MSEHQYDDFLALEDPAAFRKWFLELRAQHQRKPTLLDRSTN